MYETGRRAYKALAVCPQRVDWVCRLPDSNEDFREDLEASSADDDWEQPWFQATSQHGFQPPSVVLLEKVTHRDDLNLQQKRKHFSPTTRNQSKFCDNVTDYGTTTNHHVPHEKRATNSAGFAHSARTETKRGNLTRRKTEMVTEAEWRHGGARTIDKGLLKDGLGPVPKVASSLAVMRRMELGVEGFFNLLFSNRWSEGCLLRVMRGQLLDSLVHALIEMQKSHNVVCHSTMAYFCRHKPLVPCSKTATVSSDMPELVEERILVELDCFHPQSPPEATSQQLSTLDPSQPLIQVQAGIRCNIRGQQKPPPHDCFSPYHVQREPFMVRRHRLQSAFAHPPLPGLPVPQSPLSGNLPRKSVRHSSSAGMPAPTRESRDGDKKAREDEAFLGPRSIKDGTEPVSTDLCLTPISKLLSEGYKPPKVRHTPDKSAPSGSDKTGDKKKKKKKKGSKESTSDEEESDIEEEQEIKSLIDPSRVAMLNDDLQKISSDLIATQPAPKTQKKGAWPRRRKDWAIKHKAKFETVKTEDVSLKEPIITKLDFEKTGTEGARKQSARVSLKEDVSISYVKKWPTCPNFAEFYNFLKTQEEEERASKSRSPSPISGSKGTSEEYSASSDTDKKKQLSKKKNSKKTGVISEQNKAEETSYTGKLWETGEKKKKTGKPKHQKTAGKKGSIKKGKERESSPRTKRKTPERVEQDVPYVYISDSEIPDNITPKTLFAIMQVDRNFKPEKLKSSYSFEKMYAHRPDAIRNYPKLLNMFSKPFKKKTTRKPAPKPASKKPPSLAKESTAMSQSSTPWQTTETESYYSHPPDEPSPPLMVLGKLKDYRFLQHKNFVPHPLSSFSEPHDKAASKDVFQLLTLAMQKFVVRKERATAFGWSECNSKISITFSKRGMIGVPPLKDNINIERSSGDCSNT